MKRILTDFNTLTSEPVDLAKLGHSDELDTPLQPGEQVALYDDELMVLATVLYDPEDDYWLASPDWATRTPTPPELAATIH
jgi:hypothetical protein